MKNTILILAFTLLSVQAYCQSKNSISILFGAAGNGIYPTGIGGGGFLGKGALIYGLNYARSVSKSFSIGIGLEYSVNNFLWDYNDANPFKFTPQKASVKMLSAPLFANFAFSKYFFADAGLMFDFETSHQSDAIMNNQGGAGLGFGVGWKYNFKKINVFINPILQLHSGLFDGGVKIGTGFSF